MLETNRLSLRPFSVDDLSLLHNLHSNEEVARSTIDGVQNIKTVEKHLKNFISHQEKFGYSQWAVFEKISGKFIGRAGLTTRTLSKEIGEKTEIRFAFLPDAWGLGYASEITKELVNFSFEKLGLEILVASNGPTNEKSARVLTKNGLQYIKHIVPEGYGRMEAIRYYKITKDEFLKLKK